MKPIHSQIAQVSLFAAIGCSSSAQPEALRVGEEPNESKAVVAPSASANADPSQLAKLGAAGAGAVSGGTVAAPKQLSVTLKSGAGADVSELAACEGACVDVSAAASGGNPPYTFAWEDGSTSASRRVCPTSDAVLMVSASDTAIEAAEFQHNAERVTKQLHVSVRVCTDAGASQTQAAAPQMTTATCGMPAQAACEVAPGISLPEELTVDIPGATQRHFAKGAKLPAGRYRIEYVDGCNTYGIGCDWTVHGSKSQPGLMSCFLVADDSSVLTLTPGTSGVYVDSDPTIGGAYATYAECVAANCTQPPIDFDFPGGTLGVQRDGGGTLGAVDDQGGEAMGGRSPTFRLSRLDGCK